MPKGRGSGGMSKSGFIPQKLKSTSETSSIPLQNIRGDSAPLDGKRTGKGSVGNYKDSMPIKGGR